MADTQIMMKVPQEVIDAQVRAAVAAALAKDPEALVKAVVDAAMAAKTNTYDRTTIWEEQMSKMIRDVAAEQFQAYLAEQKPIIGKMVRERLGKSSKAILETLVANVLDGIARIRLDVYWPGRG